MNRLAWLGGLRRAVLPTLYVTLLLLLCAAYSWRSLLAYEDFWAHAAVGRWIWQEKQVPQHTLFLWTASEPWIAHSWLSQLTFFGLTALGGKEHTPHVVLLFTTLMVALPFVLIWLVWGWQSRFTSLSLVPLVLGIEVSWTRFQTRPELFTAGALILTLILLGCWSSQPASADERRWTRRQILLGSGLAAGFVLWTNFHGAVIVGLLMLGITVAADLLQERCAARPRRLAVVALGCAAATLVNPYGLTYWQALRPVGGAMFTNIEEWRPLWLPPAPDTDQLMNVGLLVGLALAAWALNRQRRWAQLGWLLLAAGLFVTARRNVWLLALVSLLVTAINSRLLDPVSLWVKYRERSRPVTGGERRRLLLWSWSVRLLLVTWVVLELLLRLTDIVPLQPTGPTALDQGAVRFVKDHHLRGRMFNDYESSSYLEWSFGGEPSLFVDLLNAYPERVTDDYADIYQVTHRGRELLEQEHIGAVLLTASRPGPPLARLAAYLDRPQPLLLVAASTVGLLGSPGDGPLVAVSALLPATAHPQWVRVYAGRDGVVWVRRNAEYEPLWSALEDTVSKKSFADWEFLGRSER